MGHAVLELQGLLRAACKKKIMTTRFRQKILSLPLVSIILLALGFANSKAEAAENLVGELERVLQEPTEVWVSRSDDNVRLFYEFYARTQMVGNGYVYVWW